MKNRRVFDWKISCLLIFLCLNGANGQGLQSPVEESYDIIGVPREGRIGASSALKNWHAAVDLYTGDDGVPVYSRHTGKVQDVGNDNQVAMSHLLLNFKWRLSARGDKTPGEEKSTLRGNAAEGEPPMAQYRNGGKTGKVFQLKDRFEDLKKDIAPAAR